ncbi:hypothetical protein HYX13_03005 [Candidatus Woesearchaeota archaeon]|nr:hypothetical protein [Candidatus Woesearchaeota archaeon]
MSLERQALTDAALRQSKRLQEAFPQWKYHEHCTLWGISYFWNGTTMNLEPQREEDFVPELLRAVEKNVGLQEPAYQVSKRRDPAMYQVMYCLANREGIELTMEDLLQEKYLQIEPLLTDKKLLTEAVETYVVERKSCGLNETIDLVHFLLYYHMPEKKLSLHQYGSFEPLAKRLTLRYGEESAEDKLFTLISKDLAKEALTLHQYALYGRTLAVAPELEKAHQQLVGTPVARSTVAPKKVTSVSMPGNKRVIHHNHALNIDWENLLKGRRQRVTVTKAFNREELLKQEIKEKLIKDYFPEMEKDSQRVMQELEVRYNAASAAEKSVFEDILEIFQGMQILEKSESIAHEMNIPVRKKGK